MNSATPLVSVILPTYNRASTLPRAISSVINQSYRNIELIIVDDFSTDNTRNIVSKFLNDGRIKYIKHNKNLGGSAARNTGLANSKGELIAFQDSDDEWLPQKLEQQVSLLISNKRIDIVNTAITINYEKYNRKEQVHPRFRGTELFNKLIINQIVPGMPSMLVKKSCLETIGGFDLIPSNQDYLLYIKLAANNYFFDFIDIPLVNVYFQKNGITSNIGARIEGKKAIIKYIEEHVISGNQKNVALSAQYFRISSYYLMAKDSKNAKSYCYKSLRKHINYKALGLAIILLIFNTKIARNMMILFKQLIGDFDFY